MSDYNSIRQTYRPDHIRWLLIAESPPPAPHIQSSRQFYYTDRIRKDDRLYTNTIKALYSEAAEASEADLEADKPRWLERFKADGWYMIEALEESQAHEVSKEQRQEWIRTSLPRLIERLRGLVASDTEIILIKSNVFEVAADPLRQAGFTILNTGLLDYPGQFNQRAYRDKLSRLAAAR